MSRIKQKRRENRHRKRLQKHRASVLAISAVLLLLIAVVSVNSVSLLAKNKEYIAQQEELEEKIQAEKERAEEIAELEEYVGTNEYIEQTARDKLGLIYGDEILFKRK